MRLALTNNNNNLYKNKEALPDKSVTDIKADNSHINSMRKCVVLNSI